MNALTTTRGLFKKAGATIRQAPADLGVAFVAELPGVRLAVAIVSETTAEDELERIRMAPGYAAWTQGGGVFVVAMWKRSGKPFFVNEHNRLVPRKFIGRVLDAAYDRQPARDAKPTLVEMLAEETRSQFERAGYQVPAIDPASFLFDAGNAVAEKGGRRILAISVPAGELENALAGIRERTDLIQWARRGGNRIWVFSYSRRNGRWHLRIVDHAGNKICREHREQFAA